MTFLPQTLRVLRIFLQHCLLCVLSDQLQHLSVGSELVGILPKLPSSLQSVELRFRPDDGLQFLQCTKLTKVVVLRNIAELHVQNMLEFSDHFIPNLSDLQFTSGRADEFLKNHTFAHLTRMTIQTTNNIQETRLGLSQRVGLMFLDLSFEGLYDHFSVQLPPNLRTLRLMQATTWDTMCYRITMQLPRALKVLEIISPGDRFHISLSRDHLSRLDVIGDYGQMEENGRIQTKWGAFIIV